MLIYSLPVSAAVRLKLLNVFLFITFNCVFVELCVIKSYYEPNRVAGILWYKSSSIAKEIYLSIK